MFVLLKMCASMAMYIIRILFVFILLEKNKIKNNVNLIGFFLRVKKEKKENWKDIIV